MNIQVTSGGLLQSQSKGPGIQDDFLTLTEPADVLEILFEFLYPDYETDLERLEFNALLSVAEAAEKYGVFYAMSHCTFCLRCVYPKAMFPALELMTSTCIRKHTLFHSAELIRFAVKYRKEKMLAELTPPLLDMELEEVITILPPTAFGEFVRDPISAHRVITRFDDLCQCIFRDRWIKVLLKCFALIIESSADHDQNQNYPCFKEPQTQITRRLKSFLDDAIAKPSSLFPDQLDRSFLQLEAILMGNGCAWCKDAFITFKDCVLDEVKELPRTFAVELY